MRDGYLWRAVNCFSKLRYVINVDFLGKLQNLVHIYIAYFFGLNSLCGNFIFQCVLD